MLWLPRISVIGKSIDAFCLYTWYVQVINRVWVWKLVKHILQNTSLTNICAGWSHPCFLNLWRLSCCNEDSVLPQSWHMQGSPPVALGDESDIGICASMEDVVDKMLWISRKNLRWLSLIYSFHCAIWYPWYAWYSSPRVVMTLRSWTTACIKERALPLPKNRAARTQ